MMGVRSGSLNSSTGVGTMEIIISDSPVAHFISEVANKVLSLTTNVKVVNLDLIHLLEIFPDLFSLNFFHLFPHQLH